MAAKPRVHEVAHELGIDSKTLLKFLRADGEFVKSPGSTIQVPVARRMRQRWPVVGLTSERVALDGPSGRDRLCSYRRPDLPRGLRARGCGPYSVGNLYPLRE